MFFSNWQPPKKEEMNSIPSQKGTGWNHYSLFPFIRISRMLHAWFFPSFSPPKTPSNHTIINHFQLNHTQRLRRQVQTEKTFHPQVIFRSSQHETCECCLRVHRNRVSGNLWAGLFWRNEKPEAIILVCLALTWMSWTVWELRFSHLLISSCQHDNLNLTKLRVIWNW